MSENEAAVKIVADATGVQPGVDAAKGEIESLAPALAELTAGFAQLSAEIRASMEQSAEATSEMVHEMHALEEETEREAFSLKEMALSAKEGAEAISEMKEAAMGFAEAFLAAFAIEKIVDWTKEFAEASEKVEHLGQIFGMTATQVQQFNAIAIATGIGLDTITRGMQILDKNAVLAAQGNSAVANAFKAIGISADDGTTQMQRMMLVADKFAAMEDGPKKVALAMELFGRSGAALIPILDRGSKGLEELTEKAKEYDVANTAVSDSAQEKGVALAEAINEQKLAWQGVTNVLGDAFAPMLTDITEGMNGLIKAFIESYNEGGVVAVVFEVIRVAIEAAGAVINTLAAVFGELWSVAIAVVGEIGATIADIFGVKVPGNVKIGEFVLNEFKDTMIVLKDVIVIACEVIRGAIMVLVDYVRMFADVAHDSFTMQWDKIDGDWKAGTDRMANDVISAANRIKSAMAEAGAAIQAALKGEALSTGEKHEEEKPEKSFSFDPKLGATKKEKTEKPKDDLVQQLDDVLTAKKLAWAMEQDAQGTAQQYSLQSEADYWRQILDRTDLSAKDRAAIETKYLAAHSELTKERIAIVIDGYKQEIGEAEKNSTAKLAIAERELAYIGKTFGLESKEYAQAQAEIVRIEQQAAAQIRELAQLSAQASDKASLDEIDAAEAVAKQRVAMGAATSQQLLAQERAFEDQRFAIQRQAAQRSLSQVDPQRDPVKYAQVSQQLETLERQHQTRLTQIDNQARLQRTATERAAISATGSLWGQNIAKMLTLQQSFSSMVGSLYMGMVGIISNALASVIEKWIEQQLSAFLFKRTAQAADGIASVTSNAAVAGSAAFASTAAIPIVGPELAPAAAAAAFAGAMSFAPMASAEGGDWNVREGLYQLHAEEMVLPAWAAKPLRQIVGGAEPSTGLSGGSKAGAGGGDLHYHDHTERGLTPSQIIANRGAVAKAMKMAHREGRFSGSSLSG